MFKTSVTNYYAAYLQTKPEFYDQVELSVKVTADTVSYIELRELVADAVKEYIDDAERILLNFNWERFYDECAADFANDEQSIVVDDPVQIASYLYENLAKQFAGVKVELTFATPTLEFAVGN